MPTILFRQCCVAEYEVLVDIQGRLNLHRMLCVVQTEPTNEHDNNYDRALSRSRLTRVGIHRHLSLVTARSRSLGSVGWS